jgi:hypothetical protein
MDRALRLWNLPVLANVSSDTLMRDGVGFLMEQYLSAQKKRAVLQLQLGRHPAIVSCSPTASTPGSSSPKPDCRPTETSCPGGLIRGCRRRSRSARHPGSYGRPEPRGQISRSTSPAAGKHGHQDQLAPIQDKILTSPHDSLPYARPHVRAAGAPGPTAIRSTAIPRRSRWRKRPATLVVAGAEPASGQALVRRIPNTGARAACLQGQHAAFHLFGYRNFASRIQRDKAVRSE